MAGLHVNEIKYATENEKEYLYLDVERRSETDGSGSEGDGYSISGKIWLDAESFLISKASFCEKLDTKEITANITCSYDVVSGIPVPKFYRNDNQAADQDGASEGTVEISFDSFQKVEKFDADDFTLTRFGLPEPDLEDGRHLRIRYVLVIIGLILAAATVARIWKRRNVKRES